MVCSVVSPSSSAVVWLSSCISDVCVWLSHTVHACAWHCVAPHASTGVAWASSSMHGCCPGWLAVVWLLSWGCVIGGASELASQGCLHARQVFHSLMHLVTEGSMDTPMNTHMHLPGFMWRATHPVESGRQQPHSSGHACALLVRVSSRDLMSSSMMGGSQHPQPWRHVRMCSLQWSQFCDVHSSVCPTLQQHCSLTCLRNIPQGRWQLHRVQQCCVTAPAQVLKAVYVAR